MDAPRQRDLDSTPTLPQRILNACLAHAIPAVAFCFAAWLFQRQVAEPRVFRSDIELHIELALEGEGYSLAALVLHGLLKAFGARASWAIAVFEGMLAVGVYYPVVALGRKILKNAWAARLLAGVLLFWGSIRIDGFCPYYYRGSIATQPWHNITYFGMRLFAVWTVCKLFDVLPRFRRRFAAADWFGLAVPLALATAMKPNFLFAFAATLAAVLALRVCLDRFARRSWADALKLGTVVLPSLAILAVQGMLIRAADAGAPDSGIAFLGLSAPIFTKWPTPLFRELLRSLGLAVLVGAFHCRRGAGLEPGEKFLYLQEVFGFFIGLCIVETGPRAAHGNFGWTALATAWLLYCSVLPRLAADWAEWRHGGLLRWAYLPAATVLAAGHAVSGLVYFARLLSGKWNFFT